MIQFLLTLLGFVNPNKDLNTINNTQTTIQSSTDLGEGLDTGGETGTTLPPKK